MPDQLSPIKKWWIRWSNWEFWPFSFLYFPVGFYYTWLSLKRGSFFFFTAANPSIEFGGMMGEKKSDIYKLIPKKYLPVTKLFHKNESREAIEFANHLGYPVIAKPDIGERGTWVEKIKDQISLEKYIQDCPVPFLIQELVTYPVELGVFYVRFPGEKKGKISSIVEKAFLSVTGDGKSTIKTLLESNPRASLQVDMQHERITPLLDTIPPKGESVEIESIGNHCRGTRFLNSNARISKKLEEAFDQLVDQIPDFHFGRFDLRCQSIDDLEKLENFKILELNGAGAEPGHIYQPGYSLLKAYQDINWHLATLAAISYQNKRRGHHYWSLKHGMKKLSEVRQYNKILNAS